MIIYVGQTFRAAKTGTAIREVKCEKCACDYRYRLFRRGEGAGSSPYYMNNKGAQRRAEAGAAKKLQKLLLYGVDPVACPDCGWIQAEMVREMQKRSHRWAIPTAVSLGIFGGLASFIFSMQASHDYKRDMNASDTVVLIVLVAATVIGIVLPFLLRWMLLKRTNPNKNYPQRPDPIPGAPKAFKPGEEGVVDAIPAGAEAQASGQLSYENKPPELEPGGWLTHQIALWPVPRVCCSCLRDADPVKQYTATGQLKLPVRICRDCTSAYRKKYAIWFVPPALIVAGAAYTIGLLISRRSEPETPYILAVVFGIVGLMLGAVLASQFARPVRFSRFNRPLNTIRVRFVNPNYMSIFMDSAPPAAPTVRSPLVNQDYNPSSSARPWQA